MRKRIRRLMNAYQLAATTSPAESGVIEIFQYLHSLDRDMGDYHDELSDQYKKNERGFITIVLNEDFKNRIQSFLNLHNQV